MHVPNLEIESTTYLKITTMSEKLRLQRVDFKDNVDSLFRRLRVKCDFADVTLACEDGQQVEAHKVILARAADDGRDDSLQQISELSQISGTCSI